MKEGRRSARDLSVGIVVTLAAAILAVAIFSIGSEQSLWVRKVPYKIRLTDTDGLQVGAPVRLVGVQVGTVTDIVFSEDPNQTEIDVMFNVDSAVRSRIRSDTRATLKVLSILGGDKFLQLTPGSPSLPELPPGSTVSVPAEMGMAELQAIGATIADDLQSVTASLKIILDQLQNRQTVLGQALFDPNFGRETLGNIKDSVISARGILEKIEGGRGLAGRLLTDEEFADATLARIEGSLSRMESLLERLTDDKGLFMRALAPDGPANRILENLQAAAETLVKTAEGLKEGKGVAGRLVSDEAYAEEVLGNLKQVTTDLKEITGKLNRGEGAAGAFINDPSIYTDVQDVLRGVQKSRMMSWLIRHYREKGETDRLNEEKKAKDAEAKEGM